ncbi:MAG: TPM domain-containing protein, partial [Acidimicrobiia bacterium]
MLDRRPARTRLLIAAIVLLLSLSGSSAVAQELQCSPYEGITCDGWVTDTAGVIEDDARLEEAVGRVVARYGHEIAVVIVPSTGGRSVRDFAVGLGDTWGVGDPDRNDGVVVLIDLGTRQTWVEHGPGLNEVPRDFSDIAAVGDSFFAGGDFDAGVLAILGSLEEAFEAFERGEAPAASPRGERRDRTGDLVVALVLV